MVIHATVRQVVVATGQHLLECKKSHLKSGVLAVMDMVLVLVTGVSIIKVLLVEHTILRQLLQMVVALIQYVLVEFIDVVLGSVTVAKDVHPMLMVIT